MPVIDSYEHRHFAHCESGVISSLLRNEGFELSEPMVFGAGGALSFAYLPFLKFGNMPLISYRMFPGHIIKKLPGLLGIKYFRKTYADPVQAMNELDEFIDKGRIVGIQTSAYFTTYFPPDMRFQFNAHNSIIVGKEDGEYLVSDPVFEDIQRIKGRDLAKARFAKGLSAPKGLVHFPLEKPQNADVESIIRKAIKKTVGMMLHAPPPFIGVKGINHLARRIMKLPKKRDAKYIRHFLGNIVRMQEEIGTGGGGFRFVYAAFLQEASQRFNLPLLQEASVKMTEAGDAWRTFALACARAIKRKNQYMNLPLITQLLFKCAETEKEVYMMLRG